MGTAALVNPTSGFTFIKKKFGSAALVNLDNIVKALAPLENGGDPTSAITPDFIGQVCVDTTNSHTYVAQTAISSGWARIDN